MIKIVVLGFFLFILYSLGSALYYMMNDGAGSQRMMKALAMRIGASIALFGFMMFAFWMGWIQPDGRF
ncbi:twin transmembrane helix small protein [Leucothrix pacifica]|uniref:twin transmembrane helix small protein n=1 Tax=Leucothrix pacifica TaxID=1247513 RepID=UPI001C63D229|nr:twin transmembrane helix small protein [Leucothrix pacifica]